MFLLWVISTSVLHVAGECTFPVGNSCSECHFSVLVNGTSISCCLLLYNIQYREITQLESKKSLSPAHVTHCDTFVEGFRLSVTGP